MTDSGIALGIDVGGSGIKGAPVDLDRGYFAADRVRIGTPAGATPEDVCEVIADIVERFDGAHGHAPIGVTIPGVVTRGVVRSAANIDPAWVGFDAVAHLHALLDHPVVVVNDADAAGIGEMYYGAAKGREGLVILTTLGTGIGTALIHDGVLIPNSELGHLEVDGHDAETRASSAARENEDLSWDDWAKRLQRYYSHLEALLWPDLFVVGGGVSKKANRFLPLLDLRTPIVPAQLENRAGIIGAAHLAAQHR